MRPLTRGGARRACSSSPPTRRGCGSTAGSGGAGRAWRTACWSGCCAPARCASTAIAPTPATGWRRASVSGCRRRSRPRRPSHAVRADCPLNAGETDDLRARVLYRDAHVIVIDKPAGLAVQGGSKTAQHLDGMLDALAFDGERPRLVHRLDKDTSGVLLLARSANAAALAHPRLPRRAGAASCTGRSSSARRRRSRAAISQPLAKRFGVAGERVGADDDGQPAVTDYRVVERAGRQGRLAGAAATDRADASAARALRRCWAPRSSATASTAAPLAFLRRRRYRRAASPARPHRPLSPTRRRRDAGDGAAAGAPARHLPLFRLLREACGARFP